MTNYSKTSVFAMTKRKLYVFMGAGLNGELGSGKRRDDVKKPNAILVLNDGDSFVQLATGFHAGAGTHDEWTAVHFGKQMDGLARATARPKEAMCSAQQFLPS
jgi:hypothetical protein